MNEIGFGIVWTAFTAFITFMFYGMPGDVAVNGKLVSHEVFASMLWPKLFLGIFWFAGFCMLTTGINNFLANRTTEKKGETCFGKIINVYETGIYSNQRAQIKGDILIYVPSLNNTVISSKVIGYDYSKYKLGNLIKLKYYDNDINILEKVNDENELSLEAKNALSISDISDNK